MRFLYLVGLMPFDSWRMRFNLFDETRLLSVVANSSASSRKLLDLKLSLEVVGSRNDVALLYTGLP